MTIKQIQSLKEQTRQLPHLYKSFKKELLTFLDSCEKYYNNAPTIPSNETNASKEVPS